jgi:threonine/homoserine/homoserine lactone efflux protein
MMSAGETALVVSFAVAMIATPGPANMLLFASGLNVGFRGTIPFLAGVLCGFQVVSLAAAAGLGGVLLAMPQVAAGLRAASVVYILYLAMKISRSRPRSACGALSLGFRRGMVVHPLNPKAYAMTIGAYATFAGSGDDYAIRAATIFVVLNLVGIAFNALWVKAGDLAERTMADERILRSVNCVLAAIMSVVVVCAAVAL